MKTPEIGEDAGKLEIAQSQYIGNGAEKTYGTSPMGKFGEVGLPGAVPGGVERRFGEEREPNIPYLD